MWIFNSTRNTYEVYHGSEAQFSQSTLPQKGYIIQSPLAPMPEPIEKIRASALAQVKKIRKDTLDRYQKSSPGVSRIYLGNLTASVRYQNNDATALAETGQTPEQYLAGLGAEIGMTAAQFAAYIISENQRLGAPAQPIPSAYDVEQRYLRASVQVQTATTPEIAYAAVNEYQAFCTPVTGQ